MKTTVVNTLMLGDTGNIGHLPNEPPLFNHGFLIKPF